MKAVNLVPKDARGRRFSAGSGFGSLPSPGSFGPAHFVVALLVIVIALIALRVVAGNKVNDKKATLAAAQSQVSTEQAEASKLNFYNRFVQAAQQREDGIREVADQRFGWQRTLDQISHVMPASTSLTSLASATTASTTTGAAATGDGLTFTLAGCADTRNQNGVATLLRRLNALTGVSTVSLQSSTRTPGCGNSFSLTLGFAGSGTVPAGTSVSTAGAASSAVSASPVTSSATTGAAAG